MQVGDTKTQFHNTSTREIDLFEIPHCCKNESNFLRIYDNGDGTTEAIQVCSEHSTEKAFLEGLIREEILR